MIMRTFALLTVEFDLDDSDRALYSDNGFVDAGHGNQTTGRGKEWERDRRPSRRRGPPEGLPFHLLERQDVLLAQVVRAAIGDLVATRPDGKPMAGSCFFLLQFGAAGADRTMTKLKRAAGRNHDASLERTHSGRFTELDPDKLRGGYYTPPELGRWLAAWAIRKSSDTVLEPSCGDGVFLEAATRRFFELRLSGRAITDKLTGIEIIAAEADRARARLRPTLGSGANDVFETCDFFSWWQRNNRPSYDVVIGNPPFIRYQTFPEPHRSRAMAIMAELGLTPNRLTNIWVPFVAAAAAALRPGGRLALVPAR